jgi:hypothetical protein
MNAGLIMSDNETISKFESSNRSSLHYFGTMIREIEMFLNMLLELSVQHEICFGHPDSIDFAEEWMASGAIVRWHPTCGDGEKSFLPELVFIWRGDDQATVPCIRATIFKRTYKNEKVLLEVEFQQKPSEDTYNLSPQQAFEIFVKLKEMNDEMMKSLQD